MSRSPAIRILAIVFPLLALARATSVHAQGTPLERAIEESTRHQLTAGLIAGAWIPTGAQAEVLGKKLLVGMQGEYTVVPAFALVATVVWSPNNDFRAPSAPAIDIFQFDAGIEGRAHDLYEVGNSTLTPFAGVGAGARSYVFRHQNTKSRIFRAGYAAAGLDVDFDRVAFRLELRDYVSRFRQLTGTGDNTTRNDVTIAAGLHVHF
jgi:hypothetical protein